MTNGWQARIQAAVERGLEGNWAELARRTGLRPSTLQGVRHGADCQVSTLLRIAEVLDLDLNWILTGKQPERPGIGSPVQLWLDEFLAGADDRARHWLEMQVEMCLPPYLEWLRRREGDKSRG